VIHSKIEWTDHTWPVLNGCRRISPGCQNCYAERLTSTRLRQMPKYKGLAVYTKGGPRWTGESRLWHRDLTIPLRLRTPAKIFVCDMGDLFFEGNSDEDIDQVFGVMWACEWLGRGENTYPGHVFQVLTKRIDRARDYLAQDRSQQWAYAAVRHGGGSNPDAIWDQVALKKRVHPRIWLGVSAENQEAADERIPVLLETPAAVRFVSAEPLLGPVAFHCLFSARHSLDDAPLDWIICGGESGPGARPCALEWLESIVKQGREADVPIFVKQMGAFVVSEQRACATDAEAKETFGRDSRWLWRAGLAKDDRKGQSLMGIEEHNRVRMFPGDAWAPLPAPSTDDDSPF